MRHVRSRLLFEIEMSADCSITKLGNQSLEIKTNYSTKQWATTTSVVGLFLLPPLSSGSHVMACISAADDKLHDVM